MPYRSTKQTVKTNIRDVLKNKEIHSATSFVINSKGDAYYLFKGQKIPEKHFHLMFPVELKRISDKGENPCKIYAYD